MSDEINSLARVRPIGETPIGIPALLDPAASYNIVSDPILLPESVDPYKEEIRLTVIQLTAEEFVSPILDKFLNVERVEEGQEQPLHEWRIVTDPNDVENGAFKISPATAPDLFLELEKGDITRDTPFVLNVDAGWGEDSNKQRFWLLPIQQPDLKTGGKFFIISALTNMHLTLHQTWDSPDIAGKVRQYNQCTKLSVWHFRRLPHS